MGSLLHRARVLATDHPVVVVLLVGLVVGASNLLWTAQNRPDGSWSADEAGYIAHALRIERAPRDLTPGDAGPLSTALGPLVVMQGTTGPLVPATSAVATTVGARSIQWATVTQPLFIAIAAAAVAAIVSATSTRRDLRPVVAGIVVLGLPVSVLSARSYQFAGAAAAALALATWALVASDRGRRRWRMVAFGAAVGALALTRTMTVAFVPGIVLGACVVIDWSRRSIVNAGLAAGTAVAVGVPWWVYSWQWVSEYLLRYGYGDLASEYGRGGLSGRLVERLTNVVVDTRLLGAVGAVTIAAVAVTALRSRAVLGQRGSAVPQGAWRRVLVRHRLTCALAVIVGAGYVALLSSTNSGIWFDVPLEVLAVALVVSLAAALPSRVRLGLGAAAVVLAMGNIYGIGRLAQSEEPRPSGPAQRVATALFADMYRATSMLQTNDPSLHLTRELRVAAADAWWEPHRQMARAIDRLRGDGKSLHLTISGSSNLVNYNSLMLVQEIESGRAAGGDTPDTTAADLSSSVEPWQGDSARVVIVIETSLAPPFPIDAEAPRLLDLALKSGWEPTEEVELPDGGQITVLVHPDSIGPVPGR